jgi:hypothetical protein
MGGATRFAAQPVPLAPPGRKKQDAWVFQLFFVVFTVWS